MVCQIFSGFFRVFVAFEQKINSRFLFGLPLVLNDTVLKFRGYDQSRIALVLSLSPYSFAAIAAVSRSSVIQTSSMAHINTWPYMGIITSSQVISLKAALSLLLKTYIVFKPDIRFRSSIINGSIFLTIILFILRTSAVLRGPASRFRAHNASDPNIFTNEPKIYGFKL